MKKLKKKKRIKKPKIYGLKVYWPELTHEECELERQKMSDLQKQKCAICDRHENEFKKRLCIDHNHKTGKVRALLCYYCNKFRIGRNTIESAEFILNYLLKYDLRVDNNEK